VKVDPSDVIVKKGEDKNVDCYSAFYDVEHKTSTGLTKILREKRVSDVYVCGLTYDFCVGYTALDAAGDNFNTFVIEDATRGIQDHEINDMKNRLNDGGVSLIHSSVLLSDRKDDMRQKAAEYFEEKRIMPLLQKLTALLVHEKPENPRQFLIEKLKQMKEAKISPEDFSSSLMTDEDLAVVFKTMDVNDRGEISTSQCKQGLLSLGVPEGEISLDMQDKTKMYSVEEFKKMAASGLKTI